MKPVSEAAIAAMLASRADRSGTAIPDVRTVLVGVPQFTSRATWWTAVRGPASIAVASVVVVAVGVALAVGSLRGAPAASSKPFTASPIVTSAPPAARSVVHLLTAAEIGVLARSRSSELARRIAAMGGSVTVATDRRCSGKACATATVAGSGDGLVFDPTPQFLESFATMGNADLDGAGGQSRTAAGAFVIRFTTDTIEGRPIVSLAGVLVTEAADAPTITVAALIAGDSGRAGSFAAVDGWLVSTPPLPCPTTLTRSTGPVYGDGCPDADYLTDEAFQPNRGSSFATPQTGLHVASGSYEEWAANPGVSPAGMSPSKAVYLLQLVADDCGPHAFCVAVPRWRIVGRLDPIEPVARAVRSPDPVIATDGRVPPPDGEAWTVAQLLDRPLGDGDFVVHGWLVATPALRCLETLPRPSGEPDFGCTEVDWLTDASFQPWRADGSNGGTRDPARGIRVQNGAYGVFAPSPAGVSGGGLEPQLGTWVVRESTHATCVPGNLCTVPTVHWEVLERLAPPELPLYPAGSGGMGGIAEPPIPPSVTPAPAGG